MNKANPYLTVSLPKIEAADKALSTVFADEMLHRQNPPLLIQAKGLILGSAGRDLHLYTPPQRFEFPPNTVW